MLPSFDRFSALLSLAVMHCAFWPSPALTSAVVGNRAAQQFSIWLSALRQPAHHRAAPKCHTPSPCGCPSCGGQCTVVPWQATALSIPQSWPATITAWRFSSFAANLAVSRPQVLVERPAYRRSASIRRLARRTGIRQNLCNSSQGSAGVARSNIYQQSKVGLCSAAVPPRPSLTCRSIRHPQAPLVGTLRASHSGAAYLGR